MVRLVYESTILMPWNLLVDAGLKSGGPTALRGTMEIEELWCRRALAFFRVFENLPYRVWHSVCHIWDHQRLVQISQHYLYLQCSFVNVRDSSWLGHLLDKRLSLRSPSYLCCCRFVGQKFTRDLQKHCCCNFFGDDTPTNSSGHEQSQLAMHLEVLFWGVPSPCAMFRACSEPLVAVLNWSSISLTVADV